MKIKRTENGGIMRRSLNIPFLCPRQKKLSVMEIIHKERACLLFNNHDFYLQEAYKSLRTNVIFSMTGEQESNVLQVTSSMPSEGKSTTAANLAISFAQNGKKTLLIDCDMRKPKLSRLLGLKSKKGLSNVLVKPDEWNQAILATQQEGLSAMTAGDIPPNPSELLGSKRMQDLIMILRKEFEYIILDTPPVNIVTDAVVLSPVADGTLLVVRAGQSERGAVHRAVEQLSRTDTKLLGFVLNGVEQEVHPYGAYRHKKAEEKGYGYGYAYTNHSDGIEIKLN